ncbi:MAG: glycosyltransferase family 2 protein [Candidatus Binatia bacterium]
MLSNPKISVVLPAYNAAAYVDEAVGSILGQTFRDFEFIIIDDGSTDATASILERYAALDGRIRLHRQENQGMIAALNRACRLARGEYVARMDADDVSLPRRLERQLEYIERRPQIGVVGTWIYNIDRNGSVIRAWRPPTSPKVLAWTHFFGVCVSHPTVLMRRRVLEQLDFYRCGTAHIEDVDLWLRASAITGFGNVPEILFKYRTWEGSISRTRRQLARESHVRLLTSFIKDFLGVEPPAEAVAGLRQTRVGPAFESLRQIRLTAALIRLLHDTFVKKNHLTPQERREISWDAARKTAFLALQASRLDAPAFGSLLMQALRLDYRLLHPATVMKGLRRALQHRSAAQPARKSKPVAQDYPLGPGI